MKMKEFFEQLQQNSHDMNIIYIDPKEELENMKRYLSNQPKERQ